MMKNHLSHAPRARAHAVLLSAERYPLKRLSEIFGVCRQTASTWLHSWEDDGICGLLDECRYGRPCKLKVNQKLETVQMVKQSPRSLKTVLQ